jgi:hypothetical protein
MKPYARTHPEFSLCGLPCGLCPRYRTEGTSRCPGCGGADFSEKHPACGVITCGRRHGDPAYCADCPEYPCLRYREMPEVDSFISYAGVRRDLDRIQREGPEGLLADIARRMEILDALLARWDDGRSKSFYCLAAQLLPLPVLERVAHILESDEAGVLTDAKARARHARACIDLEADGLGIKIKLRKPTD